MRTLSREMTGLATAHAAALALGVALGGCLLPSAAAAQLVRHEVNMLLNADGTPGLDLRTVRPNGFQLFAASDAALAGGRSTGNHGWSMSNYGDCTNILYSCQNQRMIRASFPGSTVALWFYNSWIAGAPPSQWLRIRDVAPSVANALGGGYTAGFNEELTGGFTRWGPADRTLGTLFAGIASTNDGTCADNTGFGNASVPAGIPLLAQSVCPDTWGSAGWEGARRVGGANWADWATRQGADFSFDFWRVPEGLHQEAFFGTRQHTYGETTDYYEDILRRYGSAIPGGTGNPELQGYPLGLKIRFDAFGFAMPSVNAVKFVRALVINRSEDVWGRGVDYDSLYFGMSLGELGSASSGTAHYYLPEMGAIVRVRAGANSATNPCNDSFREPVFSCAPTNGWASGSQAIIVLKSPIGDLRNKLYTRTVGGAACVPGSDPFCGLRPDLAADTFTVNQGRMCGFGACNTYVWESGGAQSGFGYLAGSESLTLDGRDINAATAAQAWSTFRSPVWPDRAHYSKWQPDPNWDYDKDGVPDTLSLTSCHLTRCVGLASDTLPGGFVNLSSNVGGHHSAGPFSLKAGDTTAFFYAVIGERDSIATLSQVNAAIDLYLNFFLAPTAPPPARVVSTQVVPATDARGSVTPEVRIFFSDDPDTWTDPFLAKLAADLASAPAGTSLNDLLLLNPGLDSVIAARAIDNLERIEIYKSCDGGATFTGDGDCVGDPTLDEKGAPVGLGWKAFQVFEKSGPNGIPSSFLDAEVQGGQSYLYAVVGKSRGASILVIPGAGAGPTEFEFAPSLRNELSRSTADPNVVSVYVPASRPAGAIPASLSITSTSRPGTVPFDVRFSDDVGGGSYAATFGNRILVHRDSVAGQTAGFRTTVVAEHEVVADIGDSSVDTVIRRITAARAGPEPLPFAGDGSVGTPFVLAGPDTMRTTTTYLRLGFVVTRDSIAFFGSTTLTATGTTPIEVFRLPDFPGFTIAANNEVAGDFHTAAEQHLRGPTSIERLQLPLGDTIVPRNVVNGFMPQFQEATTVSVKTAAGGGVYQLTWADEAFGRPQGFVINRANPGATEAEVRAALQSRTVGSVGLTDAETAELTRIPQVNLVPVRMPFTIRNLTYDRAVRVAMNRRVATRMLLGAGQDTMSVVVPGDEWIPGDALVLIEDVTSDSTTGSFAVVLSGNTIVQVTRPAVTFTRAVVGCNPAVRLTCNPVAASEPGATGYNPVFAGDRTRWEYFVGFSAGTEFRFDVTAPVSGGGITAISDSALDLIRVVPNPYVVYSDYQATASEGRVLFTNLPPRGVLRIYTVSGQFTQQITWEPADLLGDGDLFFNLRTRGGRDMASGLYIWVLQAPRDPSNPASPPLRKAGKFVLIRGSTQ